MVKILYLCDHNFDCDKCSDCGRLCRHTSDPNHAKNYQTVRVVDEFMDKFYVSMNLTDIAFIEQES